MISLRAAVLVLSVAVFFASTVPADAQNTVFPHTTFAAETANNTSTAAAFRGTINGDIAGSNISKVDIRNLLYAGSTTRIFAHFQPWFDRHHHYDVGYNSSDPAQIHNQVGDMMSRGISGAVIDWYGRGNGFIDTTTQRFRSEVDGRGGAFQFAIMEDSGAFATCANTPGCDFTQHFIDDLNYAYETYASSANYLRIHGQPVYFTFGTEHYALDWTRVAAGLKGNPVFILQNAGGFTRPMSVGAYGWVQPSNVTPQDPMSLQYITDFFWNANRHPAETPFGVSYKGFDDSIAPWGSDRHIQQNCGQTWLATFARTNQYFSAEKQLPFIQLVTWNDYEEGTAIETGIDNCVALAGAVDGSGNLAWSISGGLENTIDHYSIFISKNGRDLMKITDVRAGQHNLNIGSYNFIAGNYSVFVKAWGQPTLTNKMSPAISYVVAGQNPGVKEFLISPKPSN
ncbi:MAG: hypothetical protein ABI383_15995 [Acidobacteriaceae bacterium]